MRADEVGRVNDRVHAFDRIHDIVEIGQVAFAQLDVQAIEAAARGITCEDGSAHVIVLIEQLPHEPATDLPGGTCDENFHRDLLKKLSERLSPFLKTENSAIVLDFSDKGD